MRAYGGFAVSLLAASLVLGTAQVSRAEEEPQAEEESGSRISGMVQLDFTNAYFFRGILNRRSAFIFQPWAELYFTLYSSEEGLIRDVTVGMGSLSVGF